MASAIRLLLAMSLLLAAGPGCSGDGTGPENPSVAGVYFGPISIETDEGIALDATLSFTLEQDGRELWGRYDWWGTLSGVEQVGVEGSGSLSGVLNPGELPSVDLAGEPSTCPSNALRFTGTYEAAGPRLRVQAPLPVFSRYCDVLFSQVATVVLQLER